MILRNAHLISYLTEGFSGPEADLRIGEEEGRIEAVDVPGCIPARAGEEEADLEGKTLLPGLFDLHMHLYFLIDDFYRLAAYGPAESTVNAVAYANTFLDYGFTTIRDCGNPHYIGVALRDAIEDGRLEGPRIITAGKCISPCARGTDTSRRSFLREPGLEFLARRQVGFSNRQILEQATINSARAVFREKDFGTVAVGKIADLVVIDGDPDNNIEVMTRKPVMVFKGGRRVR